MNHSTPENITSWGGLPEPPATCVVPFDSTTLATLDQPYLAYGAGRSYGDVCLNDGGTIIAMNQHAEILHFDAEHGILRVQSGCTIASIHHVTIPAGWHVPVVPGTQWVTIGGAVANDIHGKNHHHAGSFGCHVRCLSLIRSDHNPMMCSREEQVELFQATIGGMGLTGIIDWVELQLAPLSSSILSVQSVKTMSLRETMQVLRDADDQWPYSVAWIDLTASGHRRGRGHVLVGRHATADHGLDAPSLEQSRGWLPKVSRPFLQASTVRIAHAIKFHAQRSAVRDTTMSYRAFFHPLDGIQNWNHVYGPQGFVQYQFVVPDDAGESVINAVMAELDTEGMTPYLSVLKRFGSRSSGGILSFPQPGWTLAIDLPWKGARLRSALDACDGHVVRHGGRVYAAKDARMAGSLFRVMYPQWQRFEEIRDPAISSRFWRRMMEDRI